MARGLRTSRSMTVGVIIAGGSVDAASLATVVDLRRRFLSAPELNEVVELLDDVVGSGALVT